MHEEQEPNQRPRIVAVDRDATTRALLADELDARYGRHYDVVIAASSEEAHTYLATSRMPTLRSSSPIVLTMVRDCSPRPDRCIRTPSGCC